jgi:hypothetical protein
VTVAWPVSGLSLRAVVRFFSRGHGASGLWSGLQESFSHEA